MNNISRRNVPRISGASAMKRKERIEAKPSDGKQFTSGEYGNSEPEWRCMSCGALQYGPHDTLSIHCLECPAQYCMAANRRVWKIGFEWCANEPARRR